MARGTESSISSELRRRTLGAGTAVAGLILVLTTLAPTPAVALPKLNPFSRADRPFSRQGTTLADAFPTERAIVAEESPKKVDADTDVSTALTDVVANKIGAAASVFYGAALLLYPAMFQKQIHVFTMMRAVGFGKIETAVVRARQNFRQALRAAIIRAPSLLMAHQSVNQYKDRIEGQRRVQRETRKAMEDGVVTPAERRRINRIKRREIRALKRDIRRVRSAASGLGRVWKVLDFDEIIDILRQFFFIFSTVVATGSNDTIVGKVVARYCHFLNLGNLAVDVSERLNFPLARLAMYRELSEEDLEKEELNTVQNVGKVVWFSASAYLIAFKRKFGFRLNSALIASSIIVRGIMTAIGWRSGVMGEFEQSLVKDEKGKVQNYVKKKRVSGLLMILFALIGMNCSMDDSACSSLEMPPTTLKPLVFIEGVVEKFVFIANKVL